MLLHNDTETPPLQALPLEFGQASDNSRGDAGEFHVTFKTRSEKVMQLPPVFVQDMMYASGALRFQVKSPAMLRRPGRQTTVRQRGPRRALPAWAPDMQMKSLPDGPNPSPHHPTVASC